MFAFPPWLRRLHHRLGRRRPGPRRPLCRPQVQCLEDRTVPSTVRTIVYNQITAGNTLNGVGAPLLSANGNRAVFVSNNGASIYTVNSDGSGLTKVDPTANLPLDISANGSVVLDGDTTEGFGIHLRVANADGSNLQEILFAPPGQGVAARLSPDGNTVFFTDNGSFSVQGQSFSAGLYSVPAAGGMPHQIVSADQVFAAAGVAPSNVGLISRGGSLDMGVSSDGTHLVFGANGQNGDFLVGVNADGSMLHTIGPVGADDNGNALYAAGISGDGSKVFRYNNFSAIGTVEVDVYNFDGTGQVNLHVGGFSSSLPEHVELSPDGSKLLYGSTGILYNTDGSGAVQIPTETGGNDPLAGGSGPGLGGATMDASATHFLYIGGDVNGAA